MKEIIILVSNITIKNKTNIFILNLIDLLYKKGLKVTLYSNKFPKTFYGYITKKHLPLKLTNFKEIVMQSKNAYAIIAVDYPMNIIAYKIKNMFNKIKIKSPLIIWYSINFQKKIYISNNRRKLKEDYKSLSNIDIVLCSNEKTKNMLEYIYNNKTIEIIRAYYSPYISNNNNNKEKKYILTFFNAENSIYKCTSAYCEYVNTSIKNNKKIHKLIIVGYNKYLEDNINKLKIRDYVELVDYNFNIEEIISNAYTILIHNIDDPFYTELISAWNNKIVPIIDSKTSSAEISTDNKNALIYNSQNPVSLCNKLTALIENKKFYNSLSSSIENIPSIEDSANQILEIITKKL
ncbi:glycosyltransferase family 1 protein [Brachyspira pilosicoli]|uniref:glycosyltransferase n=1 Tax=Brachyspira pilosicoli TaxID=52584 RepID=UPI00300484E8